VPEVEGVVRGVCAIGDSILTVRNDLNNNLNTVSRVYFEGITKIAICAFGSKTKYTFMTTDQPTSSRTSGDSSGCRIRTKSK
jgi:DNA-binding transcriptional regulator YhcF (GntR family)